MSSEPGDASKLEVAHILFTDMVGFSKLPMEEQKKAVQYLAKLARETEAFRKADADNLIRLTTGDGFALVFFDDPEAPIKVARELGRQLRADPRIKLRMGLHSGAVFRISNLNERSDVTGSGINMAQRVMDCGDAGHILASAAVANILGGLDAWSGDLHELERAEVKGGDRVRLFNVYADDYGNPEMPEKLRTTVPPPVVVPAQQDRPVRKVTWPFGAKRKTIFAGVAAIALMVLGILSVFLFSGSRSSSLAVVPFDYDAAQPDSKNFARHLTDGVATSLFGLQKLKVVRGPKTVYEFEPISAVRQVGQELSAEMLLRGHVRKNGDVFVVQAELIDCSNGKTWKLPEYQKKLEEISDLEDEVVQKVIETLSIKLSDSDMDLLRRGTTKNPEAKRLYQEGWSLLGSRDEELLAQASAKFTQAVAKDQRFARAYAKLADSLVLQDIYGSPNPDLMEKAAKAAKNAVDIDDRLADAHTSLAYVAFRYGWDWQTAKDEFAKSLSLNPADAFAHDWHADYLEAMGETGQAVKELELASRQEPKEVLISASLGLAYSYDQQFDEALKQLDKTIELAKGKEDTSFAQTHNYRGFTYEQKALREQDGKKRQEFLTLAYQEYEKAFNLNGRKSLRLHAILGRGYALTHQTEKALQVLNQLSNNDKVPSYYLALLHAGFGDAEHNRIALDLLEQALKNHEPALVFLKVDPRVDGLRSDIRFKSLQRDLKLPIN